MKRLFSLIVLLLSFQVANAQSSLLYEDILLDAYNNMSGNMTMKARLMTDIVTGVKDGYLFMSSGNSNTAAFSSSEISAIINVLEYAKNNLIQTSPENNMMLRYTASDGSYIGVDYSGPIKKGWSIMMRADTSGAGVVSVKISEIDKLIELLNRCQQLIDTHVAN